MTAKISALMFMFIFMCSSVYAMCGVCGSDSQSKMEGKAGFTHAAKEAMVKDGVKEITYSQFMAIRDSGEKYTLIDVLSADSYNKGHIETAVSFPVDKIDKASALKRLSKDDHIIVYCGSFQCTASTEAAKKLSALGYNVFDYKGGLKEWQEKGNKLSTKN